MKFLKPKFMQEWVALLRKEGLKAFLKEKGWKIVIAIIIFYAIRDSILYILIPYLVYTNVIE